MRKPLYTAIIATLMSAPLLAGDMENKQAKLDTDGDGMVSKTEFQSYLQEKDLYSQFDVDQDGYIGQEEFDAMGSGIKFDEDPNLTEWDTDENNYLTDVEFQEGLYNAFDADEDGYLDSDEWDDAGEAGLWDV